MDKTNFASFASTLMLDKTNFAKLGLSDLSGCFFLLYVSFTRSNSPSFTVFFKSTLPSAVVTITVSLP